ncbi:hypothetical protein AVEN_210858-1, partial [Araneus ventricosus]
HAYSRALSGHTLLLIAPSKIIFGEMNLSDEEQQFMGKYLQEATPSISTVEESRILNDVKKKYQNKKNFIISERSNFEIMSPVFGRVANSQRVH